MVVADEEGERSAGLSGMELEPGRGMLFVFPVEERQALWMPDMRGSIDAAWIRDGRVIGVERDLPPCETDDVRCPRWRSSGPVDALLEVPAGSLEGVAKGDRVVDASGDPVT